MDRTRLAVWLSVAALAIATLSYRNATRSEPQAEPARVLFMTGGSGPFWQLTAAGAAAAAKRYNVDLRVELPERGQVQQVELLGSFKPTEYDGVAISPRAPKLQNEVLRKVANDVKLIVFDSDAPESNRLCYIGTDNYSAGRLAATLTKQAVPDGGKVAILVANFDKDNAALRVQGFKEEIERTPLLQDEQATPHYQVLEPLVDEIDKARCRDNILTTLNEHPDLAAFVGMFSYHGPLLLEVLADRAPEERPQFIVFDEDDAVLDAVEEERIFATVVQDPFKYGYESVRMLAALHSGKQEELPISGGGSLFLPCEAITAENVTAYRQRLESRLKN